MPATTNAKSVANGKCLGLKSSSLWDMENNMFYKITRNTHPQIFHILDLFSYDSCGVPMEIGYEAEVDSVDYSRETLKDIEKALSELNEDDQHILATGYCMNEDSPWALSKDIDSHEAMKSVSSRSQILKLASEFVDSLI